jgi:hypothetical protein
VLVLSAEAWLLEDACVWTAGQHSNMFLGLPPGFIKACLLGFPRLTVAIVNSVSTLKASFCLLGMLGGHWWWALGQDTIFDAAWFRFNIGYPFLALAVIGYYVVDYLEEALHSNEVYGDLFVGSEF